MIALFFWVLAIVAGISWPRWAVAWCSGLVVVVATFHPPAAASGVGRWVMVVLWGTTPWLVAAERARYHRRLAALQRLEVEKMVQLQEQQRALEACERTNRELEEVIGHLTDLYHVTKETSRALHVNELFTFSLDIVPKLLRTTGLRLINRDPSNEVPAVLRARQVPDGRLVPEAPGALLPLEQAILQRVATSKDSAVAEAGTLVSEWPHGLSRVAWAPLWGEQHAMGAVIADELPPEQLDTLSVVANQLALQLSRVRLYQTVESLAVTDSLTGLFVRRYFMEFAAEELERSRRHHLPCSVVMADLDHFKSKNDTYGHLVGDVVLREVAQLMRQNLRGIDLMARYGGEEFIVLLVETDAEEAMVIAQRLREAVEAYPIRAYDETLAQTVSLGVAVFPVDALALPELIHCSDHALYAAKRAGRNRVVRWTLNS